MAAKRRIGGEQSAMRGVILDATQALMVEQGYAAVTTRSVAAAAQIKPALVQYYFPKMDDLLLAVYRRAAEQSIDRQRAALASDRPLHALWDLNVDASRTTLAVEFMALANHRKAIQAEIAHYTEQARAAQAEAFGRHAPPAVLPHRDYPPDGAALLLIGAARALVMERGLGLEAGHASADAIVRRLLDRLEGPAAPVPHGATMPAARSDASAES